MKLMQSMLAAAALLVAGLALAAPAKKAAADPHAGHHHDMAVDAAKPAAADVAPAEARRSGLQDAASYFTDLELLTQDGKKVRFYSDVLKDRTVLINVIYTNCKDACPLITQALNNVRKNLPKDSLGKTYHFVTISSDPVRDTPQALKAFAKKQDADVEGWTFLTGSKANVDHILKKLGQYSENVEGHSTMLIGGNVPAKRWSKIRANAPAPAIVMRLTELSTGEAMLPAIAAAAASAAAEAAAAKP